MSGYVFRPGNLSLYSPQTCTCIWVPNNLWAAQFTESVKEGVKIRANVVSPIGSDVQKMLLEEGNYNGPYKRFVFVSNAPFGLCGYNIAPLLGAWHNGGLNFISARQIHKGELGQKAPTYDMPQVIETFRDPRDYYQDTRRHLEQPQSMRWVNLAEICRTTKMPAEELLSCYLPFAESAFNGKYPNPWFMVTDDANKVAGQEVGRPTVRRAIKSVKEVMLAEKTEHLWISVYFASNILRLHWLGYKSGLIEQAESTSTS